MNQISAPLLKRHSEVAQHGRKDRMHIWETVAELTSFSGRLFVLINTVIDVGVILCRITHLSQEVL